MTIDITVSDSSFKHRDSISGPNHVNNSYYRCFQNYYHGHNYLNPNPRYMTGINANVNHWQLRDVLQVDQSKGDVYFTKSYSIWKLNNFGSNTKSSKSQEVVQPDYSPRCFNVCDNGLTVTGGLMTSAYKIFYSNIDDLAGDNGRLGGNNGSLTRPQKGLFTFHNPDLNITKTVKLGEMINNSVSIYPESNSHYRSYVCNNDSGLYTVDINNNDSLSLDNKVVCENDVSLNSVTKCPTSDKLLTVTGDTSSIFMLDPTMANSKVNTIETNHDSGFGVSYHPNGNMFSTAFQDGSCLLYDLRNLKTPIKEIKSTRPGHQSGAFRCCKFSNTSFNDILVILEHVGRVHLIDLRNLHSENNHQVIVFPFALDQFGEHKKQHISTNSKLTNCNNPIFKSGFLNTNEHDEHDNDNDNDNDNDYTNNDYTNNDYTFNDNSSPTTDHDYFPIYEDLFTNNSNLKFNAPLVYDYDYLTNVNPKLFKYYTYQPENNNETYDSNDNNDCSVSPTANSFMNRNGDRNSNNNSNSNNHSNNNTPSQNPHPLSYDNSYSIYSNDSSYGYYSNSYQHSDNHIYGEMELAGLDWYDSKLLIGCEGGGLLTWDVNYIARRSFGSFSFV